MVSFRCDSTSILGRWQGYVTGQVGPLTGPSAIRSIASMRICIPDSQLEYNLSVNVCEYCTGSVWPNFALPDITWPGSNLYLTGVRQKYLDFLKHNFLLLLAVTTVNLRKV